MRYQAHDCNSMAQPPITLPTSDGAQHSSLYRFAKQVEPQLYFMFFKSRNRFIYIKWTLFLDLSRIKARPIMYIMKALHLHCSWCVVVSSGNDVCNMLSNHVSFSATPLRAYSGGTYPSNSSHNSSQCKKLGPSTTRPSTLMPRCSATSSSVMVHSPHGRWKVCVSGLHRSTNAVINAGSILHCLIRAICRNPIHDNNGIICGFGSGIVW